MIYADMRNIQSGIDCPKAIKILVYGEFKKRKRNETKEKVRTLKKKICLRLINFLTRTYVEGNHKNILNVKLYFLQNNFNQRTKKKEKQKYHCYCVFIGWQNNFNLRIGFRW